MIEIRYFGIQDREFHFRKLDSPLTWDALGIRELGQQVGDPDTVLQPYLDSGVNTLDKWTEDCERCLAILACGQSSGREREILSVLVHAAPMAFNHHRDKFMADYRRLLLQLGRGTIKGTREAFVCGSITNLSQFIRGGYEEVVYDLARENFKMLSARTTFLPPKATRGTTNIYFNGTMVYIVESDLAQAADQPSPLNVLLQEASIV